MKKLTKTVIGGLLACVAASAPIAFASDYPNRPVRFVVPWPPGDLEDILTRIIAEEMSKETGKPATVVNRPGGGAVIGASDVARARPDGLTIGSFVNDLLTLKIMSKSVPWDESTFEPVGIFLDYPFVIATRSDAPYSTIQELAEYSQTNPVSLGHFGYQAGPTAMTFSAAKQLDINFSSDAPFDATDCSVLTNGDADVINTTTQLILPCLKSGEVRVLVSFTSERINLAPEAPMLSEITDITLTTWNGLFVPKGTPTEIKQRIAEIARNALRSEQVKQISETTGAIIYWQGEADSRQRIIEEIELSRELLQYMR
ncbi:tripartite tricarboxylate transporter substrate binding protein [Nitrincola alkalisediminis]|uniref:tripartite tricarboxylate transporter substrate binding protein n=1 Tax=Nitrincola alkalisediminis TaxID=1366656 RepID=UPI00187526CE|nr:tripartite tricarboxylate transporter substrate binding protein [Nitrincola alkalisediminis]